MKWSRGQQKIIGPRKVEYGDRKKKHGKKAKKRDLMVQAQPEGKHESIKRKKRVITPKRRKERLFNFGGTEVRFLCRASTMCKTLSRLRIHFSEMRFDSEGYPIVTISGSDYKRLRDCNEVWRADCERLRNKRSAFLAEKVIMHRFFIISALFALVLLAYMSMPIISIELQDNAVLQYGELEGFVEHTKLPFLVSATDIGALEREIESLDGVANANVTKRGNVLYVEISEELPPQYFEGAVSEIALVSGYDAVVTSVVCIKGTAMVAAGDFVREGDILIQPYIVVDEENRLDCGACGEVIGRVTYHSRITAPLECYEMTEAQLRTMYADNAIMQIREGIDREYEEIDSVILTKCIDNFCVIDIYYEISLSIIRVVGEQGSTP